MQIYENLLSNSIRYAKSDIAIINNKNNNEELVEKWEKGELSMKDYLYDQIGVGNINSDIIASEEEYLNKDEIYESLVSFIVSFGTGQYSFF